MAYSKIEVPRKTAIKIANKGDVATIQVKRVEGNIVLFHGAKPVDPFDFDAGIELRGSTPFSLGCALTEDVYVVSTRDTIIAIQKD